jgi:uncharacterized protein (DUF1697 family)
MRYVALLRGINVGGHAKVSMTELRELVSSLGHSEVSTYIQSGNVLFTSSRDDPATIAQEIEDRIAIDQGLAVKVLIRTPDELAAVVEDNPFLREMKSPTGLYVSFLSESLDEARLAEIDAERFAPDEFRLGDRVIYLWYPNGAGRTKLTIDVWERRFGLSATTRNWNTVTKLLSLLNG